MSKHAVISAIAAAITAAPVGNSAPSSTHFIKEFQKAFNEKSDAQFVPLESRPTSVVGEMTLAKFTAGAKAIGWTPDASMKERMEDEDPRVTYFTTPGGRYMLKVLVKGSQLVLRGIEM